MPKANLTIVMSSPDYFEIAYSINPWMNPNNKIHPEHAMREWQTLKRSYLDLGLEVLTIPPVKGLPDLVFTTDHGVMIDDTFFASRFRYPERQREQKYSLTFYKELGVTIKELPSDCYLEGGDVLVEGDRIFVGHGYRTNLAAAKYLAKHTNKKVISLKLMDDAFYHLDTCFNPISSDTAFYYPLAFDHASLLKLKQNFDLLLPLTSHEAECFVCNSVRVGNKVLCQPCPSFEQKLLDLGLAPLTHDMHEFNKSGGGIHCLSQII